MQSPVSAFTSAVAAGVEPAVCSGLDATDASEEAGVDAEHPPSSAAAATNRATTGRATLVCMRSQ
jgi:hypothetical protein